MPHLALLRGINVGRAKRIAMADLRRVMGELGFENVRTLLNSGNIVFDATAAGGAAGRIERAVEDSLGVASRVTVLPGADLERIVKEYSLGEVADASRLMVAFPRTAGHLDPIRPLELTDWAPERLAVGSRAAYLWCPASIIDSPLLKAVSREMGENVTMRNWATVLKLQGLVVAG